VAGGSAEAAPSSDAAAVAASSEASEARLKFLRLTAGGVAVFMMVFSFAVIGADGVRLAVDWPSQ
jgi:hypothetical protein